MSTETVDVDPEGSGIDPHAEFRLAYISVLAGTIGVLAGIIAFLIYHFIGLLTNVFFYGRVAFEFVSPPNHGLPIWIPLVPAFGGLVVGVMAKYGSPRIRGHGIPEAMEAVWANESRVAPRVMILKPISAAIAIGTGAPFGVEGPIIQTGGSMGSVIGQWISTTVAERKVLLACGATAGMAATFNTPLAGILIGIELLLFEFKTRSFVPLAIASVIATAVRHRLLGSGPMFRMADPQFDFLVSLPFLVVLGVLIGVAAIAFKDGYFEVEDLFERLPANEVVLPAIGGLILGVMGLLVPRTFGVGYEVAEEILNDELAVGLIALVVAFKVVGVYVTLGSKTSGGFLAPVFVAGAGIGSVFAHVVNAVVPGVSLSPALFALAGLGTMFGVASRATFGFMLFAVEVTGQFEAILPVFLVGVVADGFVSRYMEGNLMTQELTDRGVDIYQDYEIDVLKRYTVGETMDELPATIGPGVTVDELVGTIGSDGTDAGEEGERDPGDPGVANGGALGGVNAEDSDPIASLEADQRTIHDGFPVVDDGGHLVGVVTYGDLVRAVARGEGELPAVEVGTTDLAVAHPDDRLYEAVVRMARLNVEQLPVVDPDDPETLIGVLDSQDLMTSALRQLEAEYERDEGKLKEGLF